MQRMYEWRSHFGNVALDAIAAFWSSDTRFEKAQERAKYAKFALAGTFPFMYSKVDVSDGKVVVSSTTAVVTRFTYFHSLEEFRLLPIAGYPHDLCFPFK